VWDVLCGTLRAARVARREEIDTGPTRSSRVVMLRTTLRAGAYDLPPQRAPSVPTPVPVTGTHTPLPASPATADILAEPVPVVRSGVDGGGVVGGGVDCAAVDLTHGGWVRVAESQLAYVFDATATMFSSGNGSEKARMGRLRAAGETIVDLYAGIGYWTLPLVLRAGAAHVHACDWSPAAVRTLRINLRAHHVPPSRVTVWPGDNAQLLRSPVVGTADRVVLGLIPTSERGWPVAVAVLKPSGGWLHVHANKGDGELRAWVPELVAAVGALAAARGRVWRVHVAHVEVVKSFAPHVSHVVVDLHCTAAEAAAVPAGGAA